jgi:hypothetical protein
MFRSLITLLLTIAAAGLGFDLVNVAHAAHATARVVLAAS